MTSIRLAATLLAATMFTAAPLRADDSKTTHTDVKTTTDAPKEKLVAQSAGSDGSVTVGGKPVAYHAVVGTLVVHPDGWQPNIVNDGDGKGDDRKDALAAMSYVAYFAKGADASKRPITFIYNGGPGSSTVWLHMGAFGPKRVSTFDHSHTPAAPYSLVDNDESLLDASDLVFIDAPGTGFGQLSGKEAKKAFWGTDEDAHAFANFIEAFLSQYNRWNSPKYLFGESYGTTRSAQLAYLLQSEKNIDLNGVILLSQILNFDFNDDDPQDNPGNDTIYALALPTYAATAWYHHRLPNQTIALKDLLAQVESFAMGDYTQALLAGANLDPAKKDAIAAKLHDFTGLPVDYLKRANLRVNGGEFEHELQIDTETATGRLDTRFSGPVMDPLDREVEYDPQSNAISSAYVSAFNAYVRNTLHFGQDRTYLPEIDVFKDWDFKHQPPTASQPQPGTVNVMADLAWAMKGNPTMKVMLNGGYYDLATPFYAGLFEMSHLPMPQRLQANIEYKQYESGHMVYANLPSLKQLHDNVADFIHRTEAPSQKEGAVDAH
jgi:carboxypeptidase C (cathepsin A)